MDIIRNIEPLLAKYLTIFPVVGIIGPRQVGKTTLTIAKQDFVIAKINETYKVEENITITSLNTFLQEILPQI